MSKYISKVRSSQPAIFALNWAKHSFSPMSIVKQSIANNKINDNFKIVEETENGNLNYSTGEVQTLLNDELHETLKGSPTTPQLVDDK